MAREHDHIGTETLKRMKGLERYNDWVIERIRPFLGDRILEVGSGIGNISRHLLDCKELFLTDVREDYLEKLKKTFASHDNICYELYDLECSGAHLQSRGIDTIVALNVLEHIENDTHALREMAKILAPGGRIILQLPAHKALYGSLDINLDHFRRYSTPEITAKLAESGLAPEKIFRMNMFGAAGWFLNSRILKREILPKGSLGLFNVLTPAFIAIEDIVPAPFGLSLITIGRKES